MRLLAVLLMVTFSLTSFAGDKLTKKDIPFVVSGTVIDENTNEPLTGVAVTVQETGEVVYSDFDGNFSYSTIAGQNLHLSFEYISFEGKTKEFNQENNNLQIKLK